ncbi:hypothetical protein ECANGB1_696 [Enterospora canceri]|uniref:Uncharacterized protein n=1 Tax=Enterospora canceri TaxID=1081671 RepID=A0A1Y1S7K6_9MICR|nr:hypothetical protein ECANGB1_696 [Enterospora canceri]
MVTFTELQTWFTFYTGMEIFQKSVNDSLLKFVGIPSWMCLISSFIMLIISALKCKRGIFYNYTLIPVSFLITYDTFIKIYINLVSRCNMKAVVMSNVNLIFANYISAYFMHYSYNKKQKLAMAVIFLLGILQLFYKVPVHKTVNLYPRDLANFLGSIGNAFAFVIFKKRLEKKVENEWNYTFSLSVVNTAFASVFYAIHMFWFRTVTEIKIDLVFTTIGMFLNGMTQIGSLRMGFILEPFALFTIERIVMFFSAFISDNINDNFVSVLQFLLALCSVICCNFILLYDENNNFF